MYELAVIGGGPAGITAAAYALHAQLDLALFAPELGGKVSDQFALRNRPHVDTVWGADLVHQFEGFVKSSSFEMYERSVERVTRLDAGGFRLTSADEDVEARAVVVATGARPKQLYVPGEKEYWGRGVSFSAISHAPLFSGKDVAVVGAGERALLASLELAPLVNRVYLIVAQADAFAGALGERVTEHASVSLFRGWEVERIDGDGEFVEAIELIGRDGAQRRLAVEGVFIEFGLVPNSEPVRDLVELDETGHIKVNRRCETNVPALFAAGDVTDVYAEQVPVAIGEGAKAALSAWEYLATQQYGVSE